MNIFFPAYFDPADANCFLSERPWGPTSQTSSHRMIVPVDHPALDSLISGDVEGWAVQCLGCSFCEDGALIAERIEDHLAQIAAPWDLCAQNPHPSLLAALIRLGSLHPGSTLHIHAGAERIKIPLHEGSSGLSREVRPRYAGEATAETHVDLASSMIAESSAMQAVLRTAQILAGHQVPVLIQGETGTGKSLLARFLHHSSPRRRQPNLSLNCAALPEKLVESILFGHRKGAFTGAVEHQAGIFSDADQGTLFLDEIGELSGEVQAKLLRVLEDGWVQPLGSNRGSHVDVRILAATHRDLQRDVHEGRFREDLYHRLSFGVIRIPPLRERVEDIAPLSRRFLQKFNPLLARPRSLTPRALAFLEAESWPGNVRQLEHTIGRAAMFATQEGLEPDDFVQAAQVDRFEPMSDRPRLCAGFSLEQYLREVRQNLIDQALRESDGNQSAAARLLGISPQAVSKFIRSLP